MVVFYVSIGWLRWESHSPSMQFNIGQGRRDKRMRCDWSTNFVQDLPSHVNVPNIRQHYYFETISTGWLEAKKEHLHISGQRIHSQACSSSGPRVLGNSTVHCLCMQREALSCSWSFSPSTLPLHRLDASRWMEQLFWGISPAVLEFLQDKICSWS